MIFEMIITDHTGVTDNSEFTKHVETIMAQIPKKVVKKKAESEA
jgi:hypothetical protein